MLGSHTLFILGIIFLAVGGALEAGAEGAVKAVKVSAKLVTGHHSDDEKVPEAASDA
jgi:TRAP-type mannitol/chloroaromatic compound transport system permease large subunit